jgi:hypothetical protein
MEAPHKPPENTNRKVGNFTLPLPGIFTVPLTSPIQALQRARSLLDVEHNKVHNERLEPAPKSKGPKAVNSGIFPLFLLRCRYCSLLRKVNEFFVFL